MVFIFHRYSLVFQIRFTRYITITSFINKYSGNKNVFNEFN